MIRLKTAVNCLTYKRAPVVNREIIIICANNPIALDKLECVVGVACQVEVLWCLRYNHTAVSFIFGNTFLDDFKGTVGGAIV